MPLRFENYRMRDGITPLAEDYFNPVLRDLDTRIAALEDKRADLQGVIDQLSKFGLERINALMGPAIESLNDLLDQARDKLEELKIAIEETTKRLSVATLSYDQKGRLTSVVESLVNNTVRTTSLSYDENRLIEEVVSYQGLTLTTTYSYDSKGRLTQVNVSEN